MSSASDERVAVTAAAASLLTALTLAPLVRGLTWLFVAGITVVTVMVTGIVARQLLRWWPAVAAAQTLVLLLTLLLLFVRSRILEGPGAIGALIGLLRDGFEVTQNQAPPVEATQGIVLMVAGSAGLVALLVDVLAASLRQPALAGLPLLAVYCVPAALLEDGLPWYYFFAAASGFLLLLSADAGDRIRGWGRVLTSSTAGGGRGADSGMARGGRRIGLAAVLVAVILPGIIPGLGNQIIGSSGTGDGAGGKGRTVTRINPILDLRNDLTATADTPVIRYTTDVADPEPLRIVTADEFDGNTWSPNTLSIPSSQRVQDGLTSPRGLESGVPVTNVTTRIQIMGLRQTYLPLPYPTRRVDIDGTWLFDRETLNVISGARDQSTQGIRYTVASLDVRPTASQLAKAPDPTTGAALYKYLALPQNLPSVISNTAQREAGVGTDYQQAIRLQNWLRKDGGFTYSTKAPDSKSGAGGSQAIVDFLRDKRGYCVHFASTMAVMARTLGIPARVAVGFLPGDLQSDGRTRVISTRDAHAWPELYFEGVGWTRFEPTPRSDASDTTTPPAWAVPPSGTLPEDTQATDVPRADSSDPAAASPTRPTRQLDEGPAAQKQTSAGPGIPWRGLVVTLVVVLALVSPRLAAGYGSRLRWRRATTTAGLAEAAWDDLRLGLGDLGVRWAAAWTPRAVRQRLADEYPFEPDGRAALQRLVEEIESARYAPPDDALGRPAAERTADVAAVVGVVAGTLPPRRRWLVRLWPPSGVAALATLGGWLNSAAGRAGKQATALGTQVREKVGSGRR